MLQFKIVDDKIESTNYDKVYIGSTNTMINSVFLDRSNVELLENRKIKKSKYIYECSKGEF